MRLPSAIMKFFSPLFLTSLICSISLVQAKALWASTPSSVDVLKQAYPVGNGRLGGMPFSAPGAEKVVLNIDSLWSGGPFQSSVSFPSLFQSIF
jgi:alpha-L-fucosidase 2